MLAKKPSRRRENTARNQEPSQVTHATIQDDFSQHNQGSRFAILENADMQSMHELESSQKGVVAPKTRPRGSHQNSQP